MREIRLSDEEQDMLRTVAENTRDVGHRAHTTFECLGYRVRCLPRHLTFNRPAPATDHEEGANARDG